MLGSKQIAVFFCLLVAGADFAQPLLFDWVPKFYGAIAGGLLYLVAGVTIARGVRALAYVVAVMPVIPLTVLALTVLGVSLPMKPDVAMVVIMGGQIAAAVASAMWLRQPSAP